MALHIVSKCALDNAIGDSDNPAPRSLDHLLATDSDEDLIANLAHKIEKPIQIPNTAAEIKLAFLMRDFGVQTDVSEILDIKHLHDMSECLVTELQELRHESIQSERHMKIVQDQRIETAIEKIKLSYDKKISFLEKNQNEKLQKVRRAARQQLADAIAKVKGDFMLWHKEEIRKIKTASNNRPVSRHGDGGKELTVAYNTIAELESKLEAVEKKLEESAAQEPKVVVDDTAVRAAQAANGKLEEELNKLKIENKKTLVQLKKEEKKVQDLEDSAKKFQHELEEKKEKISDLEKDKKEIEKAFAKERLESSKKQLELRENFESKLKEQKEDFETNMRKYEDEVKNLTRQVQELLASNEKSVQMLKEAQSKKPPTPASRRSTIRKTVVEQPKVIDPTDIESSKNIAELQKRLERMERIYEKKEQIMKSQMHALKDESYIRSQLEKDALLLHKVDLRYARNAKAQTSVELVNIFENILKAIFRSDTRKI